MSNNKFILNPKHVLSRLKPVAMVINSTTVLPILECFLFTLSLKKLTVTATDLETVVIATLDIETPPNEKGYSFCVSASDIMKFLINSEETPTTFIYNQSSGLLEIVQDNLSIKLSTENADYFPKNPEIKEVHKMTLDAKDVFPIIKKSLPIASTDDLRPAMTGIFIHDDEGDLKLAATDAHRLYFKTISKTPQTMKDAKAIIPVKSARIAIECFKQDSVSFSFGEYNCALVGENYQVMLRMIDARYPDYKSVMHNPQTVFYITRKKLIAFIKLAINFTNKSTNQFNITINKDRAIVDGGDVDFARSFSYSIPVYNPSHDNINYRFAANAKFLLQGVSIGNDELVQIKTMEESTKAFIIDDCLLIMPLMLNE